MLIASRKMSFCLVFFFLTMIVAALVSFATAVINALTKTT